MSDWTAGYITDIGYTYGYYPELNPLLIKLAFLNAGLVFPEVGTACELGFGQGVSTNIHAAASVISWYGTDFNPSHVAFAQELTANSEADIQLFDQSFSEFCNRTDLPDFDFIALQGIWSWVSDENRTVIVNFLRRKLKAGGVLYISYNTLPGWANFAPMQHLLTRHAALMGTEGHGIAKRIDGALEFADKLLATHPLFSSAHPHIKERIENLRSHGHDYLAHEYFNRDWLPMHFATMADWLEPAKLSYVCSAHYLENLHTANFTPEQQALLKEIPDTILKETVKDFMTNQQFRRDYWIKGERKLSALERTEALRAQHVILIHPRHTISLEVNFAIGKGNMNTSLYTPILDVLADHLPRSLGQIEEALKDIKINFSQLVQAILVLIGKGDVASVQNEHASIKAKACTHKLNQRLMNQARSSYDINVLASPLTGGGIKVNRIEQLFLLAKIQGNKSPEEWGRFVWKIVSSQGEKLIKDGKTLETVEENLAECIKQAQDFNEHKLPALLALQIA